MVRRRQRDKEGGLSAMFGAGVDGLAAAFGAGLAAVGQKSVEMQQREAVAAAAAAAAATASPWKVGRGGEGHEQWEAVAAGLVHGGCGGADKGQIGRESSEQNYGFGRPVEASPWIQGG